MVITLVMDQYGMLNNGTTATAMKFAAILRSNGHTVKIVTCIETCKEDNVYVVERRKIPIVMKIIRNHGMELAHPDVKILAEAIAGSDIVHFFLPFQLAIAGKMVADKMGIASMAAFHLQPENITYNVKLQKIKILHTLLYKKFKRFYDKFNHIHVPSQMIYDILNNYHYVSNKHVISNGIDEDFKKLDNVVRPVELQGKYVVIMSGRLSHEKRQDVLIKAIAKSKYCDKIQLVLCGRGPWKKHLQELSYKTLPNNPVIFKFCSKPELVQTLNTGDLYVHTSEVELEAISCMEAFACGLVPLIANAEMSATKQFALTPENLFAVGDFDNLAEKIDWFIENPDKKAELQLKYLEYAKNFNIFACEAKMEELFKIVVEENKVKLKNIKKEQEYLSTLNKKEVKQYFTGKNKFNKQLSRIFQADTLQNYINMLKTK